MKDRRRFLRGSALAGAGLLVAACEKHSAGGAETDEKGGEVTATEDLMREHGVLRRALLVYTTAAMKLRAKPDAIPPDALLKTAKLFRAFGEDYHEKKLEEAYIFPAVRKVGGEAANYPDILIAQHDRGREITDYIVNVTQAAKWGPNNAEEMARVLEAFVLMYRHHAAREDTIIFPAWKQTMNEDKLDEINDKFEDIEHQQFGEDGFEDAVKQISAIETSLGLADIAQFTAPSPSTAAQPQPTANR